MTRARDVSRLVTTPPNIYATDSESSAGFLSLSSASSTYLTQSSASSVYRAISNETTIFRNLVINGDFNVWQRGTSFTDLTAGNFYGPDRFGFNRTGDATGMTVSRSTDAPTGFIYSVKHQRTASNTNTAALVMYYTAESVDSKRFAGKTFTFSFYAKAGANYSGGVLSYIVTSGTGTDQRVYSFTGSTNPINTSTNITSSWQRFSASATFASNINQIGFNFSWLPSGTAGADDSVYITGIQLEEGSLTPFESIPYGIEQALCQRYFEWTGFYTTNWNTASTTARTGVNWFVPKRRTPDITFSGGYNQYGPGGQLSATAISSVQSDAGGALFTFSQSGGLTTNAPSTANIGLKLDAEL